jgi:hypothetical protein
VSILPSRRAGRIRAGPWFCQPPPRVQDNLDLSPEAVLPPRLATRQACTRCLALR